MEAIQGDKLRGHLEAMVLSTLERGEAHGLEILHRMEEAGCGLLRLKEGSLYPALYRLQRGRPARPARCPAAHLPVDPEGAAPARRRPGRMAAIRPSPRRHPGGTRMNES